MFAFPPRHSIREEPQSPVRQVNLLVVELRVQRVRPHIRPDQVDGVVTGFDSPGFSVKPVRVLGFEGVEAAERIPGQTV